MMLDAEPKDTLLSYTYRRVMARSRVVHVGPYSIPKPPSEKVKTHRLFVHAN